MDPTTTTEETPLNHTMETITVIMSRHDSDTQSTEKTINNLDCTVLRRFNKAHHYQDGQEYFIRNMAFHTSTANFEEFFEPYEKRNVTIIQDGVSYIINQIHDTTESDDIRRGIVLTVTETKKTT